jgi:5-methylcytosine-specific restriction enzyme subunit McrC
MYQVKEHEEINIPSELLLSADGKLNIYQEVLDKRLLDISYNKGRVTFKAGSSIGEIPINKDIVIEVVPKTPLSNLMHILTVSNHDINYLEFYKRNYDIAESSFNNTFEFLIKALISELKVLLSEGIYKTYNKKSYSTSFPKGKVNFTKTIKNNFSKGNNHLLSIDFFEHQSDNSYNRLIKYTILFAIEAMQKSDNSFLGPIKELSYIYQYFDKVPLDTNRDFLSDFEYPLDPEKLPSIRKYYVNICNLSQVLIGSSTADFNSQSGGLLLSSFIINMAYIFESYLLSAMRSNKLLTDDGISVLDGNNEGMKALFSDNEKYKAKPDFIFSSNNDVKIIADAKYKKKSTESDRYQLISHSLSYGAEIAVIILPRGNRDISGLDKLGLIGDEHRSISLYNYYYDLNSKDLSSEEESLSNAMLSLISG